MAAVVQVLLRRQLCAKLSPPSLSPCLPVRFASTTPRHGGSRSSDSSNSNNGAPKPRNTIRRYIPEDAKRFVKPDGRLITTAENRAFLLEHDLEPDNGTMSHFTSGPELQRVASEFNVTLAYSPRHVIHPFDLRFFEPRGHPLASMKRAKYLQKTREEPLWIYMTGVGGVSAVVRSLPQRRMKGALYRALEDLGYRSGGNGDGKEIRGTLWVTVHNPIKAAALPAEQFGRVVAAALERQCCRRKR